MEVAVQRRGGVYVLTQGGIVDVHARAEGQLFVYLIGHCRLDVEYGQAGSRDHITERAIVSVLGGITKGNIEAQTETPG